MAERAVAEELLRQVKRWKPSASFPAASHTTSTICSLSYKVICTWRASGWPRVDPTFSATWTERSHAVARGAQVTHRVLAFSRRQPLSPKLVDLNALLEGMADLLHHSVGSGIAIEMHCESHWIVWCDANQMETVILNLAVNARDAMPQGGTLTISTTDRIQQQSNEIAAGEYVELGIADTGSGMTEEVRERALDPFFTTKPQGRGTGLGLQHGVWLCKAVKWLLADRQPTGRRHSGNYPDASTCRRSSGGKPVSEAGTDTVMPIHAGTVLVVDDEAMLLMLVAETLREAGFAVVEATDGKTALQLLEANPEIELLISDIKMPGMSGYEVAQMGRTLRPDLKILLMTGYAQGPAPAPFAQETVPVLYKPFNFEVLPSLARQILGKPQ